MYACRGCARNFFLIDHLPSRVDEGKILLHEEFAAESVQAVWTDVPQEHVLTLKDTVDQVKEAVSHDYALDYYRVPVTAEAEPEALDFDQLIQVVGKYHALTTAFVLYVGGAERCLQRLACAYYPPLSLQKLPNWPWTINHGHSRRISRT